MPSFYPSSRVTSLFLGVWLAFTGVLPAQWTADRQVLGSGGTATTGPYAIDDTIGQLAIGEQTSVDYGVDHGFWPGMANPPLPSQDLMLRATNRLVKVRFSSLLANDADPDFDQIVFDAVDGTSTFGVPLVVENGWVIYQPPAGFNTEDTFTYRVVDSGGDWAMGTVVVRLVDEANPQYRTLVSLQQLPNGSRQLSFIGIAGRSYIIQASEDLSGATWRSLGVCIAGPNGIFNFLDIETPPPPQRYYRVLAP